MKKKVLLALLLCSTYKICASTNPIIQVVDTPPATSNDTIPTLTLDQGVTYEFPRLKNTPIYVTPVAFANSFTIAKNTSNTTFLIPPFAQDYKKASKEFKNNPPIYIGNAQAIRYYEIIISNNVFLTVSTDNTRYNLPELPNNQIYVVKEPQFRNLLFLSSTTNDTQDYIMLPNTAITFTINIKDTTTKKVTPGFTITTQPASTSQTPTTATADDDDNFDLAGNLDWLFNPELPIPGIGNMPPAYVAPAPLSTPADILAAIKKLSAPEQAQITQALVTPTSLGQLIGTFNQTGINQLLAASPFSNPPTMPTSTNSTATTYLNNFSSALTTLRTIMHDTINSKTLASLGLSLPMTNYLRDEMLYFAATLPQPAPAA